MSTLNSSVKHEVFKYEVIFKNEADPNNPIVSFALGLDTMETKVSYWAFYFLFRRAYLTSIGHPNSKLRS